MNLIDRVRIQEEDILGDANAATNDQTNEIAISPQSDNESDLPEENPVLTEHEEQPAIVIETNEIQSQNQLIQAIDSGSDSVEAISDSSIENDEEFPPQDEQGIKEEMQAIGKEIQYSDDFVDSSATEDYDEQIITILNENPIEVVKEVPDTNSPQQANQMEIQAIG